MRTERTKFIGGAGSGKTRAILDAIISLTNDPHEVSFASMTNAARDVITKRVSDHYGVTVASLTSANWRTTHSTAIHGLNLGSILKHDGSREYVRLVEEATQRDYDVAMQSISLWNLARHTGRKLRSIFDDARKVWGGKAGLWADHERAVRLYEHSKRTLDWVDLVDPLQRFAGFRQEVDGVAERCRPQGDVPSGVRILVLDEAQDACMLIAGCQHRLEDECGPEHVILAADPYQSIFSFSGGNPRHFLDWAVDREVTMERSWRCAPAIFALGQRCLRGTRGYRDYGIKPAEHDGEVIERSSVEKAVEAAGEGSVMFLARTTHRCDEIVEQLSALGIQTNFIGQGVSRETLGFRAAYNVSRGRIVSASEFAAAVAMLPASGFFERGVKARWERGEYGVDEVVPGDLRALGVTPEGCEALVTGSWTKSVKHQKKALTFVSTADRMGVDEATTPRISVGTIHRSKGLEADTVIVDDALPAATMRAVRALPESADEERRVSYVAVTRGRKRCIIMRNHERYRKGEGVARWMQ